MKKERTRSIYVVLIDEDQKIQLDREVITFDDDGFDSEDYFDEYSREMFDHMIRSLDNFG